MPSDTSMRLEADRLVPTDYKGDQEGPGIFFGTTENPQDVSIQNETSLSRLRIARADPSLTPADRKWYAVTHHDLQQEIDPIAWVGAIVEDTPVADDTADIWLQLQEKDGEVFVRSTGAVLRYFEQDSEIKSENTLYVSGFVLAKPLIVVHMPTGTVFTVEGTVGENAIITPVSTKQRYTAVGYVRDLGATTTTEERVFKSSSKQYTANLTTSSTVVDALPSWAPLVPKALRGEGLPEGTLMLVENIGLCRILDYSTTTGNLVEPWSTDKLVPWSILVETNAIIEIRDTVAADHYFRSSLSQHTIQVTSTGVHLLTRPQCSSNKTPLIFEHHANNTSVTISDHLYSTVAGVETSSAGYTLGPVAQFNTDTKKALQYSSGANVLLRTLALERTQSNEPVLDTDGLPKLIVRTYSIVDGSVITDPSANNAPTYVAVHNTSGLGIPTPLEYEFDDLRNIVLEVAIHDAASGRIRIVRLLWYAVDEQNGVWTLAPSYLLENAWLGSETVSHLRVVGGRDANSTRTGDLVVAGGVGVGGTIWCQSCQTLSDATRKTAIAGLRNCLNTVRQFVPSTWQWRNNGRHDSGFIAQDLMRVVPNSVHTDPQSGIMAVNYNSLMPYLSGAVQELADRVEQLESCAKRQRTT